MMFSSTPCSSVPLTIARPLFGKILIGGIVIGWSESTASRGVTSVSVSGVRKLYVRS